MDFNIDVMEWEFNDIDISAIIQKAVMLANKYLPEKIEEEVTVYFLYGIRGTGPRGCEGKTSGRGAPHRFTGRVMTMEFSKVQQPSILYYR